MRTFFSFRTQIVFAYFSKKWHFYKKKTSFLRKHPKTLFFWVFLTFSFSIFSCFLFFFLQHKKTKTKSAHFFSKTFFLTPWQTAQKLFSHPYTLFVFFKIPKKHYKTGEKQEKSWTKFWRNLGPSFDSKTPNLGPSFDSTAYIYIFFCFCFIIYFLPRGWSAWVATLRSFLCHRFSLFSAPFFFPPPWEFWGAFFGRKHPSRDVIFSGQNLAQKMPKSITSHDVPEPLKQVLSASRDVIISGQVCGSKLQRVFTFGVTDAGCPFSARFQPLCNKTSDNGTQRTLPYKFTVAVVFHSLWRFPVSFSQETRCLRDYDRRLFSITGLCMR